MLLYRNVFSVTHVHWVQKNDTHTACGAIVHDAAANCFEGAPVLISCSTCKRLLLETMRAIATVRTPRQDGIAVEVQW